MNVRISATADDNDDELIHRVAALERTALAWERTGIGVASVGALLLHQRHESPSMIALGASMLATAAAIVLVLAPARYRAARKDVRADTGVVRQAPPLVTALVIAAVGLGLFADLVVRPLVG